MQPKHARQPIRKPAREQCTHQSEQIVEHRDRLRHQPGDNPQRRGNESPHPPRVERALVEDARTPEQTDVDVFRRDVAVDDARDDDGGQRDAVRDLLEERACASEGGRGDVCAGVAVGDGCDDEVHRCVDGLEETQRFGVVLRVLELGDEAEEGDVAGIGEDDIRDR